MVANYLMLIMLYLVTQLYLLVYICKCICLRRHNTLQAILFVNLFAALNQFHIRSVFASLFTSVETRLRPCPRYFLRTNFGCYMAKCIANCKQMKCVVHSISAPKCVLTLLYNLHSYTSKRYWLKLHH